MELAILGMGRMGKGMALRLTSKGHQVICYNRSPDGLTDVRNAGCTTTSDVRQITTLLRSTPRVVIVMLPSGDVTTQHINIMLQELSQGDILIDGGNSHYTSTLEHASAAKTRNIAFFDIGVSGGLTGATQGYCVMAGGDKETTKYCEPILKDLAQQGGYAHVGPIGAGHYVKMVHNAIEYAQMQAIGEGFDVLAGGFYKERLDLAQIAELFTHGSIIRGYLMECTASALQKDPALKQISDAIDDNNEGQWTVQEALVYNIPFLSATHAVFSRYLSRQQESFAYKIVAAQRHEFGGHATHPENKK